MMHDKDVLRQADSLQVQAVNSMEFAEVFYVRICQAVDMIRRFVKNVFDRDYLVDCRMRSTPQQSENVVPLFVMRGKLNQLNS